MMVRVPKRFFLIVVLVLGVLSGCAGCGPNPSNIPNVGLSIGNYTTIAVTLVVNGKVIETVPAGGYEDPIKGELPVLPWHVETRSPSGRVLSSMTVDSAVGGAVRADLSCGRLDVWSETPILGPPGGPGQPGDCA